jgi:hypothetical protein
MDVLPIFSRSVAALTVNLDTHSVHLFFRKLVFLSFLPSFSSLITTFLCNYFLIKFLLSTAKMRYSSTILLATSAVLVLSSPVPKPLNINMGAYSPALVVGDGAIGFKGTESVTNLMNTLQGAAANSAAANGAAAPAAAAPATTQPATPVPAEGTVAQDEQGAAVTQLLEGMGKNVVTRTAIDEDAYHLSALNAEIETRELARDTADDFVDEDLELDEEEEEYKRDVADELEGEVYRLSI